MENIFAHYKAEEAEANIKSTGGGIYTPGIHNITGAELFLYETEWEGQTFLNCDIVVTNEAGGTLTDSLRTSPKSNQTDATTDMLTYMYNIALVTGKLDVLATLKSKFATLPTVKYVDRFKNEHKAKSIKIFANTNFKVMTYSEVSGDANGVFTNQRLTLNQVFRAKDNASLAEIKEEKDEVGASFAYWTDDPIKCAAKAVVQYSTKRDESDTAILEVIVDHLKEAKPFTKEQREAITNHWDLDYAKSVLKGTVEEQDTSNDVDVDDVDEDDDDTPAFG